MARNPAPGALRSSEERGARMNIDRYTKVVLTIIAGCLLWICAMGAGPSLSAQRASVITNAVQPVVIVGTGTVDQQGTIVVNYIRPPDGRVRTDPTIPVTLPYTAADPIPARLMNLPDAPLAVEISSVRKTGDWEPIRVRVEEAPPRPKPGGGGR
jgi:hypothetical protein